MLLQHLKVVFLICGMLINHEDVRVEFGDDEAEVKLTDDLHLFEHVFTVRRRDNKLLLWTCHITFSQQQLQKENPT